MRQSNILDPIHAELDPRVWDSPASDKPVLKPLHAHWIKRQVYKTLEDAGYTDVEKWLSLVLTGSLTTYQYSDDSDVDISLFVDTKVFPEWSRAEMIALMVDKLDGTTLPGTPFPLQDFVVGQGIKPSDLYKPGLRSGYNLDNDKWIVPPERSRVHDVKAHQGGFYAWALQMADKMERLLRYEPEQAIAFWHSIHKKRQRDMVKGKGDFAESNIIYKMLANRGLFPQISQASGEYIAKTAASDWFAPSYMIPDDAKQQIHEWAQTLPWPEGSKFAPPERYHVTGIYSPSGFSDPSHHEWIESHSGLTYPVQTTGVDNFTPSKIGEGAPVVLRVHHPQLEADTERLIDEAQQRGLPVSRFPGGYKPHITVGHSPTPIQADHPGLSFPVGPLRDLHGYYDELKRTAGAPIKPPNLRQGAPSKNCLSCKMYHKNKGGRGKCWGYGEFDVRGDQLCDSYAKETRNLMDRFTKTAAARVLYNEFKADPVHPRDPGEKEPQLPFIYNPDEDVVHLGPAGAYHWQLITKTPELRQHYQGDWEQPAFQAQQEQVEDEYPASHVHGNMAWPSKRTTFLNGDPATEGKIRQALGAPEPEPDASHWDFQSKVDLNQVAERIYQSAVDGSGSALNLHGEPPHTRYGFAPDLSTQTQFELATFSPKDVISFIQRFQDRLADPEKFVGSWLQGDKVVMDVSEGHDDFDTAYQRAWAGHQKSLWDNEINDEIPVRGLDYVQPTLTDPSA